MELSGPGRLKQKTFQKLQQHKFSVIVQKTSELCVSQYIGKGRALCVDYGDKRVGLAISDIDWRIASPLVVLESHGVFGKLKKIIEECFIVLIVVGEPKALCGGMLGLQNEKVKKFVKKLDELYSEIAIVSWDERMSTAAARRFVLQAELSHAKKKQNIDKIAASFILFGFLNYCEMICDKISAEMPFEKALEK